MITLSPLSEKSEIAMYFSKAGIQFDEYSGCVAAKASEDVLGFCLYRLYKKGITVLYIEPQDDLLLADGILRSTLHVAAERSATDARYEDTANIDLLKKLDFILDEKDKKLDIEKLFRGCECSHKTDI